jgi:HPt (histidine-containing phosphotransfer) domain-containing protein
MDGYLSKPFQFSEFRKTVLEHVSPIGSDDLGAFSQQIDIAVSKPTSCFDPKVVTTLKGICNDEEIYQSVIEAYLSEGAVKIESIERASKEKDYQAIATAAHALKSSSMNIGAMVLGEHLEALEFAAVRGESSVVEEYASAVAQEYRDVIDELAP